MKRRTPLRRVSVKRLREKPLRDAVRDDVEGRDGPGCLAQRVIATRMAVATEKGWPLTCWHPYGTPLDLHERIPRSAWPGGHLVASNVILVCRRHHEWIDRFEVTAATLGLHGYSWERPAVEEPERETLPDRWPWTWTDPA